MLTFAGLVAASLFGSHLEYSMGFMGGVRDETRAPYTFTRGGAEAIPYAQALAAPFASAPFNGVAVYGLSCETRLVSHFVRLTFGLQKPFASFRQADVLFPTTLGGVEREVGARSLSLWDLRFALGVEYPFTYV